MSKLTTHEIRNILAKFSIGQAYDLYLGPKELAAETRSMLAKCSPNEFEEGLVEIVMVSFLYSLRVEKAVLGQVTILAQIFNSADEQTQAHLKTYCEKAHKFWLENKDNRSLLDEINESE